MALQKYIVDRHPTDKDRWRVREVETGKVVNDSFTTRGEALREAERLTELAWRQRARELRRNDDLDAAMKEPATPPRAPAENLRQNDLLDDVFMPDRAKGGAADGDQLPANATPTGFVKKQAGKLAKRILDNVKAITETVVPPPVGPPSPPAPPGTADEWPGEPLPHNRAGGSLLKDWPGVRNFVRPTAPPQGFTPTVPPTVPPGSPPPTPGQPPQQGQAGPLLPHAAQTVQPVGTPALRFMGGAGGTVPPPGGMIPPPGGAAGAGGAGAAGGGLSAGFAGAAQVAGGVSLLVTGLLAAARQLHQFAEHAVEANRKFADVSPGIAYAMFVKDQRELLRSLRTGQDLAPSALRAVQAEADARDSFRGLDVLGRGLANKASAAYNQTMQEAYEGTLTVPKGAGAVAGMIPGVGPFLGAVIGRLEGIEVGGKKTVDALLKLLGLAEDEADSDLPLHEWVQDVMQWGENEKRKAEENKAKLRQNN